MKSCGVREDMQLDLTIPVASSRRVDTSQAAGAKVSRHLRENWESILALLQEHPEGLTPDRAAQLLGWTPFKARPRFSELYKQGRIERVEKRRSVNNSPMWAWRLRAA